jgi:hypothetical protein
VLSQCLIHWLGKWNRNYQVRVWSRALGRALCSPETVFDLGFGDAAGFLKEPLTWSYALILGCAGPEQIDDFFSAGALGGCLVSAAHGSSS